MARLVRCPKCTKLLVENPEVPVYKCGGCSTVLRAKNHKAASEDVVQQSPQTNVADTSSDHLAYTTSEHLADTSSEHGLSDAGSTSPATAVVSSSEPAPSADADSSGESPQLNQPDVISENGFSDKEMPPTSSSAQSLQEDHDEEEKRPDIASPESNEKELQSEFKATVVAVESQQEEIIQSENDDCPDRHAENPEETVNEVGQSSQSVARSIASKDDTVDMEQDYGRDDNRMKSAAEMSPQTYDGSISSSDDGRRDDRHPLSRRTFKHRNRRAAAKDKEVDISENNDEDRARALLSKSGNELYYADVIRSFNAIKQEIISKYEGGERGRSFDSSEFMSVDSWMEPEKAGPYRSPLKGMKGDLTDHMELLRKVDELKAQIVDLYSERGDSRQRERFDQHRPSMPSYMRRYEHPEIPFSGHTQCSCLHCVENHRSHFSAVDLHPNTSNSGSFGHNLEKPQMKERPRRHCRPVSGAAPFVVCYNCMKLLQLPADFLVSRRKLHKLQCGACNEVLMLSFPGKAPATLSGSANDADGLPVRANIGESGGAGSSAHSSQHYGLGPKGNGPPRLHRLMGYDSATELLYTRSDLDDGYESVQSPARRSYAVGGASARGRLGLQSMEMHSEYDAASRMGARGAAVGHPRLFKGSPNSM